MDKLSTFRAFVGASQRQAVYSAMRGEEGEWFRAKVRDLIALFETMPKVYEQDGKGEQATAYLHYFTPSADWYITERDISTEQLQAFGLADLYGDGGEFGYISIEELTQCGAELDLHFEPRTLASLRKAA